MEDDLWIMIDVETSGPIYGHHSLTEIGAVVGSKSRGVIDRFGVLMRPICGARSGEALAPVSARSARCALRLPIAEHVERSKRSFARALESGEPPEQAMKRFAEWCRPYLEAKAKFVARPAAFDWPWIVYYAWTTLGENPFGFKAVCASSWFESRGRRFEVTIPHEAVRDAEIQLEHFLDA